VSQREPGERKPYAYSEHKTLTCGTTDKSVALVRYPDEVRIYNSDSTNTAYVKFDQATSATDGYPIPAQTERRFFLRTRTIHGICSAGTPKLFILALAYRDERISA
jgi:hypothetical protein